MIEFEDLAWLGRWSLICGSVLLGVGAIGLISAANALALQNNAWETLLLLLSVLSLLIGASFAAVAVYIGRKLERENHEKEIFFRGPISDEDRRNEEFDLLHGGFHEDCGDR